MSIFTGAEYRESLKELSPEIYVRGERIDSVATPSYEVSAPATCGDPEVMARYRDCTAAEGADACATLGGTWGPLGLSPDPFCQCPTGDGDCPCTKDSDCSTLCLAPTGADGINDCSGLVEGTCSAGPTVGCWCRFDENGEVSSICID